MSDIKISSTGWLAVSLSNRAIGLFDLNDISSWQYISVESIVNEIQDDEENAINFNRNLIGFSPDGEFLVVNGQNKQVCVYSRCDFEKTEVWWKLQRMIIVKKSISALDLTNEFLFIADIIGDVYKVNLSSENDHENLIITTENCIMTNVFMILDIALISVNDKLSFILTVDQDNKICLNSYPNISLNKKYCLGHTEFVSRIKMIDNNHILAASRDGTLRLWRLPDCVPLVLLHSKALVLLSKQIFYTQLYQSYHFSSLEDYRTDAIPQESLSVNYSIWKMDVTSFGSINSDIYIAFSIYSHRFHSIYLTTLTNIKKLNNEQRKLIFDLSYGTIVDYCFPSKDVLRDDYISTSKCYLYILFDSNILLKIDIISILLCDETELFEQSDGNIQEINRILASREFHVTNLNNITSDDIIFDESFQNSNDHSLKRKIEKTEQQQRKKPAPSPSDSVISSEE